LRSVAKLIEERLLKEGYSEVTFTIQFRAGDSEGTRHDSAYKFLRGNRGKGSAGKYGANGRDSR
jgi:hypothetical protein